MDAFCSDCKEKGRSAGLCKNRAALDYHKPRELLYILPIVFMQVSGLIGSQDDDLVFRR